MNPTNSETKASLWPGLILVIALAAACRFIHHLFPVQWGRIVGEVVIGLAAGLFIGNTFTLPHPLVPGIQFSFKTILRLAIIFLGARLFLQQLVNMGMAMLILIISLMALLIWMSRRLGRIMGVSSKLGTLIGLGSAVCGNTAITVAAPVINASDEEVSLAIASNTLFGSLAVFLFPILGHALGLTDQQFGMWAGTSVNDTSQVVGTGFSFSLEAGEVATAVKLTRNALMAFVIVIIAFLEPGHHNWQEMSLGQKLKKSIPSFVFGFLALTVLNSFGFFSWCKEQTGIDWVKWMTVFAKFFILMALVGAGLSTKFAKMRHLGKAPFFIGFLVSTTSAVISFLVIRFLITH